MARDVAEIRSFLSALRQRPGLYLPAGDWKYVTAVAYLERWFSGAEVGLDREVGAWLGEPSIA